MAKHNKVHYNKTFKHLHRYKVKQNKKEYVDEKKQLEGLSG